MKLITTDEELQIIPEGGEKFWALKRAFSVPRSAIARARWIDNEVVPAKHIGFRVGTAMPGMLLAGRFYAKGAKNFLYIKKPKL
jgi:hypothetical protein